MHMPQHRLKHDDDSQDDSHKKQQPYVTDNWVILLIFFLQTARYNKNDSPGNRDYKFGKRLSNSFRQNPYCEQLMAIPLFEE